ncbi:MAG TPA: hydrogenase subunit MbhD domain-containing protein [Thermoanaerobaculia bacterium]|nr:hydrogenase subunit MbhD domain-containing protein [Thermoanaerobaculia bacterium]
MIWLQTVLLLLIAAFGAGVVATHESRNQVLVLTAFGMLLSLEFFAAGAPDVALAEIVVGGVALPALIMLALARTEGRHR